MIKQVNIIAACLKQVCGCIKPHAVLFFVLLIFNFLPSASYAQNSEPILVVSKTIIETNDEDPLYADGPLFTVSKPTINAVNEELVDLVIKIVNTTDKLISASMMVNPPLGFQVISKVEIPVQLQPGDSIFVPVKIFVDKKAPSNRTHVINFTLRANNVVIAQTRSQVRVTANRNVSLFGMVSNIMLNSAMDSIIIPVRIVNSGNTAQKITLIVAYPASVQDGAFHLSTQIVLQPSTDTLINFAKVVNRKMANSEGFNVSVTGLYENSDMLGMAYVRVQSAKSNRNYYDLFGYDNYTQNSITLSSQSMFAQQQSYMLRANGGLDFSKSRLGYNVDLTTWNRGYSTAMLRNTFVDYQTTKFGARVGNINRNFDINLSGRGGAVFLYDTSHGNRYEAGYMDGNTNLLGNNYNNFFPTGQAGWTTFTHSRKKWQLSSFAVYESNPSLDTKNAILGNTVSFTTPKGLHYTFGLNGAHTSEYLNTDSHKFGMAATAGVNGTIGNFSINSNNYFSTAYYPGIQRGAVVLSERVSWTKENTTLWTNVDYNSYDPATLSTLQYTIPAFGMLRAEMGISGKLGKVNVSGAPRYVRETSDAYILPGASPNGSHSLTAWDLATTLNYAIGENHYFSLNTEAGTYSSSFDPQKRLHMRSNAYYRKGFFNVSATAQLGTFFLGEAANNFASKVPTTYVINIIPSVQTSFFRNRLRTELSVAFMKNNYSDGSWFATGRAEYDITSKTSFYAMANYNRITGYSNTILEMGITRKLQLPKIGVKRSALELFVYRDINRNGIYDAGDSTAGGYMLYINDEIFTSSANGTIIYKNLPDGNYRINMPVTKGWYSPEQYIKLDKKTRLEIPLQKTGIVKGGISFLSDAFSYENTGSVSGITITATDSSGKVYTTKTSAEGNFVFYIPMGHYSVTIEPSQLPSELELTNGNQQINADTETMRVINFKIKVKSRKIETKKFVSPSIPGNK